MKIYTGIKGNLSSPEWKNRIADCDVEYLELDQWTAQKSRFVAKSDRGNSYAVALERRSQLSDGDIVDYDPSQRLLVAIRIRLNDVMAIDLGELAGQSPETIIRIAVELGHAIGNQHWPAVVKDTWVYVPLTVDRKVMDSVMRTHHIEYIGYDFRPGDQIIPYLAPHEIRRLFGAAAPDAHTHSHTHSHAEHCHSHAGHTH